jgi:malonyl-CoA O-methyltransferase
MRASDTFAQINRDHVRRRFDRVASGFDAADFAYQMARNGLYARLEPMALDADLVVDLGCGTGAANQQLVSTFKNALVVGCDLSLGMLSQARRKRRLFLKPHLVQADALNLPFADHSVDVVFSNLMLPWAGEVAALFTEVQRVLRKDGLFLFSTLGPDSFRQLRRALERADPGVPTLPFLDMHDLGDAAVSTGLREPVLDVDRLTVTYPNPDALLTDLKVTGAGNCLQHRRRALFGKTRFGALQAALEVEKSAGVIPVDLEVVYGHCWGSGASAPKGEYAIDAGRIGLRQRSGK